jgi:hypothetical protein
MYAITIIVNIITFLIIGFFIYKFNKKSNNLINDWQKQFIHKEISEIDKQISEIYDKTKIKTETLRDLKHHELQVKLLMEESETLYNNKIKYINKYHEKNLLNKQLKQKKDEKINIINEIFQKVAKNISNEDDINHYFNK